MREALLGLPLELAQQRLLAEGITPRVSVTAAPRRQQEQGGMLRVVHASDDGTELTAARFFDPICTAGQEKSR